MLGYLAKHFSNGDIWEEKKQDKLKKKKFKKNE